jgi:uncharacterized protein YhjY with autotransporter beta-barrel domain/phospholipase/lecithinase/hemolysin
MATIGTIVALGVTALPAHAQFTSVTDFGDSYADTGSAPGGAFQLLGVPCPAQLPTCRFTGSTNFVDSLQAIYGLPTATNYAIGGARTDNSNTLSSNYGLNDGFTYELQQLAAIGTHFTNSDLILLSIGGNDLSLVDSTKSPSVIEGDAIASAQREVAGVQQMVAVGAHNIVLFGTGSTRYFPEPPTDVNGVAFSVPQRDDWANTYYLTTEQLLAPLAHLGVRIFLFDYAVLQARLAVDPGQYGFASATNCEAGPGSGTTPITVQTNFPGCFYDNSVHPTGAGMALVANYMANQIDAPTTVVPQGGIVTSIVAGFAGSVFGRLDADRTFQELGSGGPAALPYAMETKAPAPPWPIRPAAPEGRWSVYGNVIYASGGGVEHQFLAPDYDYGAVGGLFGIEYRVDPRLLLGGVFGYSNSTVHLAVDSARDDVNSYQFAGYSSFTDRHWFADSLIAYGLNNFALSRAGVIDTIYGSTAANTFTAAGQTGYLVDAGPIRVGPIGGLTYTLGAIEPYTESGDYLITMVVDRQALEALTADAGLQLRLPFVWHGNVYSPFVNVTAEQDFLGAGRVVTTTQVTTPLLPVLTPVPDDNNRTYGKVATGVAAKITGNVSATVTAATTFARQGGNEFMASSGITVGF